MKLYAVYWHPSRTELLPRAPLHLTSCARAGHRGPYTASSARHGPAGPFPSLGEPDSLLVHVPPIKEHANLFVTATLVKRGRCLVEVLHNQEQV